tara:strand:+ start:1728 stop:2819 length:1092 start_codon:yes stop_codon:yes gene_type:complete
LSKKIKLFDPSIGKQEENALMKVLKSHFWASGSGIGNVSKFEDRFKKFVGAKSCIAVNSGTAALNLALSLFNLKNKEVILPSLSFVSTAHSILINGGKPVFVDVEPDTLNIDIEKIEKKITKKTIAILPVHFAGLSCKINEISKICKTHNLSLIEDAAHAAGSKYKKKRIGGHGDAVCFSFHPVKNLAMPTGGIISLNHKNYKKMKKMLEANRWCGITNRRGVKYDVKSLGNNYYMNEFSAAIGIEQLKKLDKLNLKRKKIAKIYSNELEIEKKIPFNNSCSYHLFWIQTKNRETFMKKMSEKGIETGIHYLPIHKMSLYSSKIKLDVTENAGRTIVSLPIHTNLTDYEVDKIIKYCNKFSRN